MYFYSFLKHYNGMNWKHLEFQTTIQNYNPKCWVEPEIFKFFQHKVERTPHFTQVTEKVYIYVIYLRFLNTASPIQYIFQLCVIQHYPPSWTMIHWINLKFILLSNSVSKKKSTYVLAQSFNLLKRNWSHKIICLFLPRRPSSSKYSLKDRISRTLNLNEG